MLSREVALSLLIHAKALVHQGRLEGGIDGRFLGLACWSAGIPLNQLPGTCCHWDQGKPRGHLRGTEPLKKNAWIFHPVKTLAQMVAIDEAIHTTN